MVQAGIQQWKADSCFTFAKKIFVTFNTKRKMTSIKARLNRSRKGKDDMHALVIQVIHGRQKCELRTPYRLKLTEFNNLSEKALTDQRNKTRAAEIREINDYIIYIKEEVEKIVLSLAEQGEFTVADISRRYKARNDMSDFFVYADYKIAEMRNEGRDGTASNYLSAVNALARYLGCREISLNNLTKSTIEGFMNFQKQQRNKPNTVVFYIKQLRAIYNKADDDGYVHTAGNPFEKVKLKGSKTAKRAISQQEMRKIAELNLEGQHEHKELARDLFQFSLFTRGMSFVDMCYLRKENICGDMLIYRRRKTDQQLEVKIEPPLKELLNKYKDDNSDYLLPMLRADDSYDAYRYIQRRLNKRIHELGVQLGFDFPLTFYVARHTWATMARDKGFSVSAISAGMGHTSEKTTQIYLASMNHRIIDRANKAVINCWISRKL